LKEINKELHYLTIRTLLCEETQKKHRKTQKNTEKHRKTQKNTEKHRKTQKNTENKAKTQKHRNFLFIPFIQT
jgi:hypothetical protein